MISFLSPSITKVSWVLFCCEICKLRSFSTNVFYIASLIPPRFWSFRLVKLYARSMRTNFVQLAHTSLSLTSSCCSGWSGAVFRQFCVTPYLPNLVSCFSRCSAQARTLRCFFALQRADPAAPCDLCYFSEIRQSASDTLSRCQRIIFVILWV